MTSITGYTKERMKAIEDNTIVSGDIVGDDLILTRYSGATLVAGDVRGPEGPAGPGGTPGDDTVTTAKIVDGAVTTAKLDADAVTGAKIANDSINSEHYVDGSIDRAHLASDVIDSTKLANDSVNSEHYVNGSIDTAHLSADAVDGTKIANDSINSEHYVNGSIDAAHLASGSVTQAKLASNSVGITQLDSTSWTALPLGGGWSNYGGRQAAQYRRVGDEVQLRGTIKRTGSWTTTHAAALPSGFRPVADDSFPGTSTGADRGMYWFVETNGYIYLYNGSNDTPAVSLSGIRFSISS